MSRSLGRDGAIESREPFFCFAEDFRDVFTDIGEGAPNLPALGCGGLRLHEHYARVGVACHMHFRLIGKRPATEFCIWIKGLSAEDVDRINEPSGPLVDELNAADLDAECRDVGASGVSPHG
jgi:hypothetical protein